MLNQEQLAAIAAAMSILQQQQQQQAILNQYQAELQQSHHLELDRPSNQINSNIGSPTSPKLCTRPPITTITPPLQHTLTATSLSQLQLPQLQQHHQSQSQVVSKIVDLQQSQSSTSQVAPTLASVDLVPSTVKPTKPPISYSAIVAKSTSSTTNNKSPNIVNERKNISSANGINDGINNICNNVAAPIHNNHLHNGIATNGNITNNNVLSHLTSSNISRIPSGFATVSSNSNDTYVMRASGPSGCGLDQTNSLASSFSATATTTSSSSSPNTATINSELISRFGNLSTVTNNLHANSTYRSTLNPLSLSSSIVRNSLNDHIDTNASKYMINNQKDIFSNNSNNLTHQTNNITRGGLGQSNGSLLKQHNSIINPANNLQQKHSMAFKPTQKFTTEHSNPAHLLFSNNNNLPHHHQQQNLFLSRHQNMPTDVLSNQAQQNQNYTHQSSNTNTIDTMSPGALYISSKNTPAHGRATNLLGFMGLYVGNLSPDLSKEQLEKLFSKYGEPVKAHRLIRSPVAFIKYENTESPRAAIDDLYGVLFPELTLNRDQPLKLHFDRNDTQLKSNYRPTELPADDNGECYGWRTTVCRRGKSCPKKHIPINRGIDFQMWMIKSTPTSSSSTTLSNAFNNINE